MIRRHLWQQFIENGAAFMRPPISTQGRHLVWTWSTPHMSSYGKRTVLKRKSDNSNNLYGSSSMTCLSPLPPQLSKYHDNLPTKTFSHKNFKLTLTLGASPWSPWALFPSAEPSRHSSSPADRKHPKVSAKKAESVSRTGNKNCVFGSGSSILGWIPIRIRFRMIRIQALLTKNRKNLKLQLK